MVVSAGTAYAILSTRVGTRFVQRRLVWAGIGSFALMSGLTYATVLTRPTPPLSIHEALLTAEIPHPSKKQLLLLATAAAKGLFISSTLALRKSPLLTQTALAAAASVLAVAYTGATARSQHYVYIAAPALAGVAVAATALAVPPVGVGAWGLLLGYGAVASFTGCVVRDVAKIVKNAGKAGEESSAPHQGDVVSEAVWVYVDIMNVFSMF
ncbi:hypothetical protein HDU82_000892 [Entophlyctis luteolus]|nr:hypothetical protein HDU82_000892 [Entophlyctis luteolus]